jgi:hypothetical protein
MAIAATTGTYAWNLNTYKIIAGALRLLGAIQTGETVDASEYQDCLEALNALTKHWQSTGIHVWSEMDLTLFINPSQYRYVIGHDPVLTDSQTHFHNTYAWLQYALTATALTGATTLTISTLAFNAGTGPTATIGAGYIVGVWLDAGTTFWTTVVSTSGTSMILTDALPSQASSGAIVVVYAPGTESRPLRVPAARRYQFSSLTGTPIETPMMPMSRTDYANTPNKGTIGTPTQFFYDPSISSSSWIIPYSPSPGGGQLFIWPAPSNNQNCIKFTAQRPLQDFSTQANLADLPQEWILTLRYGLAVALAPEYDCSPPRFEMLKGLANEYLETSKMWDREPESIRFGVSGSPSPRN